ncbi:MAG: hypothetical protein LBG45_12170, partial [Dysgonamonadaceae bacterium]|nr:hypothetical protein [Dysgonamonadaceae bacterium]
MKQYFLLLIFIGAGFSAFAIDRGSIRRNNLPLYPIRNGATPGDAVEGVTFDFKAVTVGTKTWVWTNLGENNLDGNNWSSRFRFWFPAKQESNLSNRIDGTQQTYGIIGIPDMNPCAHPVDSCVITFLQEVGEVFYETDDIAYNYARLYSVDTNDQTPPVLNTPTVVSLTDRQLHLSLSATDDSGDFFYYIEDAANKFVEVSFFNEATLHLSPDKVYEFSIYAVDFSGNQSEAGLVSVLPADIRNGSDFYIIYMDSASEAGLGTKVKEKTMLRDIDKLQGLTDGGRTGKNAWRVFGSWVALDVVGGATGSGWNGGAIVACPEDGKELDLTAITDNPKDYYFHFATKSPSYHQSAGWTLIFYSNGDTVKYYVGPDTVKSALGLPWLGNYAHDDQWHHFEIPVSQLVSKGYKWNGPLNGKQYLLGFQSPANEQATELNLDAIFFYKKQDGLTWSPPNGSVFTEGTAQAISFKIDSRSLSELKIECTAGNFINDAFV